MSELTYIHRSATTNPQTGGGNHVLHEGSSFMHSAQQSHNPQQIELALMQGATARMNESRTNETLTKVTNEARRWKEKYDSMSSAAKELAYKAAAAAKDVEDIQAKHRNLYENHSSMQSKYKAMKEELATLREAGDSATALQSDWRQNANKWKSRCQELASKFEEHVRQAEEKLKSQARKHEADRERMEAELDESKAALKRHASKTSRNAERLAEEITTLRAAGCKKEHAHGLQTDELKKEHKEQLKSAKAAHERLVDELKAEHKEQLKSAKAAHERLADELKKEHTASEENRALQQKLNEANSELDSIKSQLKTAAKKTAELEKLKQEVPAVKEKILQGKMASKEADKLREELEEAQRLVDAGKDKLLAAKQTISEQAHIQQQMLKETEQLKVSAQQHASNTKACAHVLSTTQQVLQTCTEFHAMSKKEDSPLSLALAETTKKVDSFLKSLNGN